MKLIVSFLSEQEVRGRFLESSNESNVPDLLEGEIVTIGKVARTCGISKKVISRDIRRGAIENLAPTSTRNRRSGDLARIRSNCRRYQSRNRS